MTIIEALIAVSDMPNPTIRRASWNAGMAIQWRANRGSWMVCLWPNGRYVPIGEGQGVLTPTTMIATDWEVVP